MGLLLNLVKAAYTMDDFDREVLTRIRGSSGSHAGVVVTEQTAMRLIDVYACVRVIAETIGSLPVFVYKERQGGGHDKIRDHPVFWLLHDRPNDEMTSQTWRETQTAELALSGNCYSVITTNMRGQAIDVYPVEWTAVEPQRNSRTGRIEYLIEDRGKFEVLPAERVLHVMGIGMPDRDGNGIRGYSPIRVAAEAIGMGLAATEFLARFYGSGMNIGGVIECPELLDPESRAALRADIEERGAGLANSWRPLILDQGMKFNRIPMPLRDAQTVEILKLNRDQICGLFRVPPHMIANMERSTFSNIEHQSLEFVKYTILPWLTRWEQALNWKLFTRDEREQGFHVKFNVEGLLRGDYKSRQEGLAIQRQNGVINADEWRELEERNPIPDGSGQKYLVNGNMIPIGSAGVTQNKEAKAREGKILAVSRRRRRPRGRRAPALRSDLE